jgi:branched-chain amino acid transport system substrate-binding protein
MGRWAAALLAPALAALALGACGGGRHLPQRGRPAATVDVYSSLPLSGPEAAWGRALAGGIALAYAQSRQRAGSFHVRYISLSDAGDDGAVLQLAEANARRAASDRAAVYYIGELDSATSEASMPILNEAGIAELSPSAGYVGLTRKGLPGAAVGDPGRLQPAGHPSFLRLLPNDDVEAAADLEAMRSEDGCRRVEVAYQGGLYGSGQQMALRDLAGAYHASVTAAPQPADALAAHTLALALRRGGVGCLEVAGTDAASAAAVLAAVHAAARSVRLLVAHPLCSRALTRLLNAGTDGQLLCTQKVAPLGYYPGASGFRSAYRRLFGAPPPSAWALVGYEAMKLGLSTIASLGAAGDDRASVLHGLFSAHVRSSPLGSYRFDAYGDSTLRAFWLYSVDSRGRLQLVGQLQPATVL